MGKPIVVGVDDDVRIRESLESLLEAAGYAHLMFGSAQDFLNSGALEHAACVILDVRMPGVDGIELQRRIRLTRPGVSVIFISAHGEEGVRQQALDGGAATFFYKPFDAADLLAAIRQAL
jgi:FixJ family two-component response regulator